MTTLSIQLQWSPGELATMDILGALALPSLPATPGIYRFRITDTDGTHHVYVGETDNLQRRMAHYRKPGPSQFTNLRLNARLRAALTAATGRVEVSTVTTARVSVNGNDLVVDLSKTAQRRLLENAALVEAEQEGADRLVNL
ncbi:MAG TPA: hypothetical protein VIN65_00950 [Candidatus Dormibacteraeota bacterium]|jgi:hypothetical protein